MQHATTENRTYSAFRKNSHTVNRGIFTSGSNQISKKYNYKSYRFKIRDI